MASTQQLLLGEGAGGAEEVYVEDVFSTYLYTGTGSSLPIVNNIDLATKGGLTWIKKRNSTAEDHWLTSTANTVSQYLGTAETDGYRTSSGSFTSFNTDGFTLGSSGAAVGRVNTSGGTYASWTFRKQPKFFDVVTYTGNGTAGRTVAHSLGSVPGCVIVKQTSSAGNNWKVYHRSLGGTKFLNLSATTAAGTDIAYWNNTDPTSTVFTVGDDSSVNANGSTYVAYIFANDAGGFGLTGTDNVISCGSYAGTGAAGNSVTLGYEPQWILLKETTTAGVGWYLQDVMRGLPTGGNSLYLQPNTSAAETGAAPYIDVTSTGFQLTTGINAYNGAGRSYIYIAIRRGPMKVPTDGTTVYNASVNTNAIDSSTPVVLTPEASDLWINSARGGNPGYVLSKLIGWRNLNTTSTRAEDAGYVWNQKTQSNLQPTSTWWSAGTSQVNHFFKRAPSFFDVVCYTGDGLASRTVTHNLGVVPELIIVKTRDGDAATGDWIVYHKDLAEESSTKKYYLMLNGTYAQSTSIYGGFFSGSANQSATAFKFTNADGFLGYYYYNYTGKKYISYLFATCAGVSKVGSYTGTGTTKQVDCGFAAGARFVLIKRTDSTGDWYVWDTARGIVSGNDPYLLLNSTAAEVTTTDYIDTYAAGFEISSTAPAAINASGGTFIYLAIA